MKITDCKCGGQGVLQTNAPGTGTATVVCTICPAIIPEIETPDGAVRVWNTMQEAARGDFAASVKRWPVRNIADELVGHVEQVPTRSIRYVMEPDVSTDDIPAWEQRVNLCNAVQLLETHSEHVSFTDDGFTLHRPDAP